MKKVLFVLLLMLSLCGAATATQTCYANSGIYLDPPTTICVTYTSSNFNQAVVTWNTTNLSDSAVFLAHDADLGGPSVSREVYDPTMVTSHSVAVGGLVPGKTYGFYVASCTAGPNCPRTSNSWNSSPFGAPNQSLYQFTMPGTNSGHAFAWSSYMSGSHYVYQQKAVNLAVNGFKVDGPTPANTLVTAVSVDGSSCFPLSVAGSACGATHFTFQFVCGNVELVSPGTNNFDSHVRSTGPFNGDAQCGANVDTQSNQARFAADSSAAVGGHVVSLTLQEADGSLNAMATPVTVTYALNVEATPTFSRTTPTSFPSIPNLGAWNARIFTLLQNYTGLVTANTTLPGVYCNDNASAFLYDFNPCGLLTYDGADRVPLQIADYLTPVVTAFQGNHAYNYGDMICTNGASGCTTGSNYVLTILSPSGCVSGSSLGAVPAPGATLTTGNCSFGNVGNKYFWYQLTERSDDQHLDFELAQGQFTFWQEWNNFHDIMACFRRNASCNGSRQQIGITYGLYPFVTGNGAQNQQKTIYVAAASPTDTVRPLAYDLGGYMAHWLATGSTPANEVNLRVERITQIFKDMLHYSPIDGVSSTYACCLSFQNFDVGFTLEDYIQACAVTEYQGGTCDPVIPTVVGQVLDWMYSNQFNLTGGDYSQPYQQWTVPFNTHNYNYNQTSLNPLTGPAYEWYRQMTGNSCTLPTSGVSCITAADTYMQHSFDNIVGGGISGKEGSQWYKWWCDYDLWRTGVHTANQLCILPTYNTFSVFPGTMEPFPSGEWQAQPQATSIGSTTATIKWYNFQSVTNAFVKYGTSQGSITTQNNCGANTVANSTIGMYLNTCNLTGLQPSTFYYFGIGDTNGAGTAYSQNNILVSPNAPYQFQTARATGPMVVTHFLPNGTLNVAYDQFIVGAGGTPPYTWAKIGGSLPSGITMSTAGEVHGTPTQSGLFLFSVKITDHLGATGTGNVTLNINSTTLTITTMSLPNGTQNAAYSQPLSASGGTQPYTWDISAGALPGGLTVSGQTGVISGIPTTPGVFTFTARVTDASLNTATQPLSITIASSGSQIVVYPTTLPDAVLGIPYNQHINATGGTPPYTYQQP